MNTQYRMVNVLKAADRSRKTLIVPISLVYYYYYEHRYFDESDVYYGESDVA